jgi:sodium-coupled neutral amino acid transporter 11
MHYSAHEFCDGLSDNTPKRVKKMTGTSFGCTVLLNLIFMISGFLTFGGNCQSMVLNNYSPHDVGAIISRIIVAVSLVGSYPIIFRAMKSSLFDITHKGKEVPEKFNKLVTGSLLGVLTGAALVLKDAGMVISLNGAVMGSAIIYGFPSLIFLKLIKRLMKEGKLEKTRELMIERFANKALIGLGGIIAIAGSGVILLKN